MAEYLAEVKLRARHDARPAGMDNAAKGRHASGQRPSNLILEVPLPEKRS
jgi:hypothetical protein